eukprot:2071669-Prymnesium_polylepis.2
MGGTFVVCVCAVCVGIRAGNLALWTCLGALHRGLSRESLHPGNLSGGPARSCVRTRDDHAEHGTPDRG